MCYFVLHKIPTKCIGNLLKYLKLRSKKQEWKLSELVRSCRCIQATKGTERLRNILQVKARPCREPADEYLLESTNVWSGRKRQRWKNGTEGMMRKDKQEIRNNKMKSLIVSNTVIQLLITKWVTNYLKEEKSFQITIKNTEHHPTSVNRQFFLCCSGSCDSAKPHRFC